MHADHKADSSWSRPCPYPRTNHTQQACRPPLPADIHEPTSQNDVPAAGDCDRTNHTLQACRPLPPADVREPTSRNDVPANCTSSRDDSVPPTHTLTGSTHTPTTLQGLGPAPTLTPTAHSRCVGRPHQQTYMSRPPEMMCLPTVPPPEMMLHLPTMPPTYPQVNRNHNLPANTPAPTTSNHNCNCNHSGNC